MLVPHVHYARSADGTHIAYQVAGDGPVDLLIVAPAYSNIELIWTIPSFGPFLTALASISRVIFFDPAGRASPTRSRSTGSQPWRHGSPTR